MRVRIGIISNQENHCITPDSSIGFGTGSYPRDDNTCGNQASDKHRADNGGKNIKAMGYILVQWVYKCNVKNIVPLHIVNDQCPLHC